MFDTYLYTLIRKILFVASVLFLLLGHAFGQTCPSGQFWNGCDNGCAICIPGMWCQGSSNPPRPCNTGTSNAGASNNGGCYTCPSGYYVPQKGFSECLECPAGFSCSSFGVPTPCDPGYYSLAGSSTCTQCPAGSYCASTSKSPVLCPPGSYSSLGATSCTLCTTPTSFASISGSTGCTSCPSDKTCIDPTGPQDCPEGTYISGGSPNLCLPCPPGYSCPTVSSTVQCNQGSYSPGGAISACLDCPSGYYSSGTANSVCLPCPSGYDCSSKTSATQCLPGTYSPALASACEDCPVGTYQDLGGQSGCKTCPPGSRCPSGSSSPISCGAGFYSNLDGSECLPCPSGTWSDPADDFTTCAPCPAGYSCTGDGSRVPCTSGTYALEASDTCAPCPAGYSCASTTSRPQLCTSGYSEEGEIICKNCPLDHQCLDPSKAPEPCETGMYSPLGSDLCFSCPAGTDCSGGTETTCPTGHYSYGGVLDCTECPAGYMCPLPSNAPIACRLGYYSAAGATECTPCPAGSYCPDTDGTPQSCPSGSFSLPAATLCIPCLPGFYCPSTTSLAQVPCEQGTYSTGGSDECTPCPLGKACPSPKGGEVDCIPGYYSLGLQITCLVCPAGYFCANPSASPVECPSGTFSTAGSDSCEPCPEGYFCPKTDLLPQLCPAGTYSTGSATECSNCSPGYVCGIGSNTATPVDGECQKGFYCPEGTVSPQPCPAGKYGIKNAGVSESDACTNCPEGYFCELGTYEINEYNLCPRGHYCRIGTRYSTEFPCPAGTYLDALGSEDSDQCVTCEPGYYCPLGSATYKSQQCPPGYYCPSGTARSNQFACPAGTFNDVKGGIDSSVCKTCPAGYHCNPNADTQSPSSNTGYLGLSNPIPCERGYYKDTVGTGTCSQCPAGYPCPFSSTSDPYLYKCRPGHYCPAGSFSETMNTCPPGTYSDRYGLRSINECEICPRGFYCPHGTGGAHPPLPCSQGHYCPGAPLRAESDDIEYYGTSSFVGTKTGGEYPCPAGTYSSKTNLFSKEQCEICPKGYWCSGGLNKWNGECSPGFYCPEGSWSPTMHPCPAGTYSASTNLASADECTPCPKGSYCGEGFMEPVPCPVGTYSNFSNAVGMGPSNDWDSNECMECPAGYSCPLGSPQPIACGVSKYSSPGQGCCKTCEIGHYCPLNTTTESEMWDVYRCFAGMYCTQGQGPIPTTMANACPVGHFCVEATQLPEECPAGTYAPNTGLKSSEECSPCPRGFYCSGGKSAIDGKCSPGYYCPENSTISTQNPCPRRTYRDHPGAEDEHQCNVCPNGFYCEEATVNPIVCPPGFYCIIGGYEPESCPIGTYSNTSGLKEPEECTPCPAGLYCDGIGATAPSGLCDPGFYCIGGAFTSAPPDPPTGGLCPRGGYCEFGSSYPTTCEKGTYNNFTGGRTQDDCYSCPAGYYCAGSNLPLPSGLCSAGWYCTGGASLPTQHEAEPGYYTDEGATEPIACPRGTYGIAPKQATCSDCPEGNYCPVLAGTSYLTCIAGHYCPTRSEDPTPCPEGTYTSKTGLKDEEQCLLCDPGSYCEGTGLTSVTGPCAAGYYCPYGSSTSTPPDYPCPTGHYCLEGTVDPTPCEIGTFSNTLRNEDSSSCISCSPGKYCQFPGLEEESGDCSSGYYCTSGSDTPTPTDGAKGNICPQGSYCPNGSSSPIPCPPGSYSDIEGQGQCFKCPPGYYCPENTIDPIVCPEGSYCPEETGTVIPECPAGSYSPNSGLEDVSECLLCSAGKFCSTSNLASPDGVCDAGVICYSGSIDATGTIGILGGNSDECPPGHYCPSGVVTPTPCPIGTFRINGGGRFDSDCNPCSPGKFCPTVGLTAAILDCAPGYYCISGAVISKPKDGTTGNLCPKGKYCPPGTSIPVDCPEGSFANILGLDECLACPEGFFCDSGTLSPTICPQGRYCPPSTGSVPPSCPSGSYSNQAGLKQKSECTLCDGGKYCSTTGLTSPDGDCIQGYFCTSGAVDQIGTIGELGGVTGICPPGHYCETKTEFPIKCPPGTFSPDEGNEALSFCQLCSPGKYCPVPGQTNATYDCDEGYYCTSGASVSTPIDGVSGNICPKANYCPAGSSAPLSCLEATYNDIIGQSECKLCPMGYYCDPATEIPSLCPTGKYCPEGTGSSQPECPEGSYRYLEGAGVLSDCFLCPGGYYCDQSGLDTPTASCSPGYYCTVGALSAIGEVGILGGEGGECPPGTYCPQQSELPIFCPNGTFREISGGQNINDCEPCSAGTYCNGVGLTTPSGNCSQGYYCPLGQTVSSPPEYICPPGYYCPTGSIVPLGCPGGYYQPGSGEFQCHTCPEGFYCNDNATAPIICPKNFYCPIGTEIPIVCPNGTYGIMEGIKEVSECGSCPPGKYCTFGEIQGDCSAGYICISGSPTKTPEITPYSTCDFCICPKGYYCPEGTHLPIACPGGTFGMIEGGMNSSACGACQPGDWCLDSSIEPIPCPIGSFCPNNETVKVPVQCPISTYNDQESAASSDDCLPCKPGYYCPELGLASYLKYPCPTAHYCELGSSAPVPCPEGTFRNLQYGNDSTSCDICPPGFYCPLGSDHPLECAVSQYCPEGTGSTPQACPAGRYCGKRTHEPEECPAGFYCEEGTITPTYCPIGHYCPTNSSSPTLCPYGYRRYDISNLRVTVDDACIICEAGTYGNDTSREFCRPCGAGYVCLTGATRENPTSISNHRGYICPTGYKCPPGTSKEIPCSPGTYNPNTGYGENTCIQCAEGTFSYHSGSLKCSTCGPSAVSTANRSTCACVGANRVYQHSDGACICASGYAYYSGTEDVSNQDSTHSCVPIVYNRCVRGQVRSFAGICVNEGSEICKDACDEYGGIMNADTKGICECNNIRPVEEVCDAKCRQSRIRLQLRKQFEVYDPVTDTVLETFSDSIVSGTPLCSDVCPIEVTVMQNSGFLGLYIANLEYFRRIFQNRTVSTDSGSVRFLGDPFPTQNIPAKYKQRMAFDSEIIDGVVEPVVCLTLGSGMAWDVSGSKTNYPVYVKDSTLNSNPDFDSGPFRNLKTLMQSNATINLFVYMFQQAGTYVFSNAGNANKITVIRVMESGLTCPDDQTFKPLLASNLATLSVVVSESPYLSPDLVLIIVLCVGFILFIALLLLGIHFFRTRTWSSQYGARPKFRKNVILSDNSDLQDEASEKTIHLERFNVRLFMEKLKNNKKGVDEFLDNYKDDLDDKYASILRETALIKEMLGKQAGGTKTINVDDYLTSLPLIKSPNEAQNLISELYSQMNFIQHERDSKTSPDVAHLDTEVAQRVLDLDDKDDKNRQEILNTYRNLLSSLKEIQKSMDKLNQSKKLPQKKGTSKSNIELQLQNLTVQFNQTIGNSKNAIKEQLSKLNETITAKNNLMKSGTHDFTLSPESAERLRDFLQETLKDIFINYRQKEDEKLSNTKKEAEIEENSVEEDIDDEIEELGDDATELQLLEHRYRKQKRDMKALQKDELEQLEEDIDKEFLNDKESLEKHFASETANQLKQIKNELRSKIDSGNVSEEEQKILVRDSKKRMEKLKDAMEKEKTNQIEMLTRLMEQKKAQKLRALQNRHSQDRKNHRESEEKEKQELDNLIKRVSDEQTKFEDEKQKEIFSQTELLKGKLEARKQQKAKAHLFEKMYLDEYLDKIDKIDRDIVKQKNEKLGEMKIQNMKNLQAIYLDSLKGKTPKEEIESITKQHEEELKSYQERLEQQSKEDEQAVLGAIKDRRSLLTQQVENRRALAEQAEIKEEEKELDKVRKLMESTLTDSDSINAAKSAARRRQEIEMQKKLLELSLRREEKKRLFEEQKDKEVQKIENERAELIEILNKKLDEDISKRISQKANFVKQQLEQPDLNSTERDKILLAHKMDIDEYKQRMEESRRKQMEEINKKMNDRLHKVKRTLEKRTKEDTISDLTQQEKLLDQNLKQQYKEIPKVHIELSKKAKDDVTAIKIKHEEVVDQLKKKFDEELNELTQEYSQSTERDKISKKHEKAKKALENQLQADLAANKDSERDKIMKKFAADMEKLDRHYSQQLKSQEDSLQQKLAKRRAELLKRQQEKMNNLTKTQTKETEKALLQQRKEAEKKKILDMIMDEKHKVGSIEDAISSVIFERQQKEIADLEMAQRHELKAAKSDEERVSLKMKHLDQRVQLKKCHLDEKAEYANDFEKYKDLVKHGNEDQQKIQEDMELLHDIIMKQKEANIARIERQKQALREQMQKELEEESRKAKEEEEKMRKRLEKAKNELQVEELVQEVEKQQQELLAQQKDLEKGERERLLEQHQLNLSAFEDALEAERIRQEDILRKRIESAEALEKKRRFDEALEKMNAQFTGKRIKKETSEEPTSSLITNIRSERYNDTISKFKKIKLAEDYFPKENSWVGPLYQRIKNIESQVLSEKRAYIDPEDPKENEGTLSILTDASLNLTQLLVCRFGHFILFSLQQKYRTMRRIKLLIAKTLPKTSYIRNAFKNSFYFDETSSTLFIKDTRLSTVGKFVLTIVHCLAHIHSGNMFDDTHPDFLKYFYAFMSGVSEEFFTTRQVKPCDSSSDESHQKQLIVKELLNLKHTTSDPDAFLAKIKVNNPDIENAPQKVASEREYLKFEMGRLIQEKSNVSSVIQQLSNDVKNLQIALEAAKQSGNNVDEMEKKLQELQMKSQSHITHLTHLSNSIRKIEAKILQ